MTIKERILNEMVESEEDKLVRELRGCKGFDEKLIRERYSQIVDSKKLEAES